MFYEGPHLYPEPPFYTTNQVPGSTLQISEPMNLSLKILSPILTWCHFFIRPLVREKAAHRLRAHSAHPNHLYLKMFLGPVESNFNYEEY